MTKQEASERFNDLPREHRVTIIGNDIDMHIRFLNEELRYYKSEYSRNYKRIKERIKGLEKHLKELE